MGIYTKTKDGLAPVLIGHEHEHDISDIINFPESLPANGGNADTVNGFTVEAAVPADAIFTDTTYDVATESELGLVKSGGDITISDDGTMTVNDNSHNHTVENIEGLEDALNNIDIPNGIIGSSDTGYITNACDAPFIEMNVYGKSTQGYASHGGTPLGKNLFEGSQDFSGTWEKASEWLDADETYNGLAVKYRTASWKGIGKTLDLELNVPYTISFYAKTNEGQTLSIMCATDPEGAGYNNYGKSFIATSEWARFSITFTCTEYSDVFLRVGAEATTDAPLYLCGYQLEKSDIMTEYEPYICNPNPDCPVPIESVGDDGNVSVTACGKNLLNIQDDLPITVSGVTISRDNTGNIILNGTATAAISTLLSTIDLPYNTYTMSIDSKIEGLGIDCTDFGTIFMSSTKNSVTIKNSGSGNTMRLNISPNIVLENFVLNPQIEIGSVATEYEPYTGNTAKITTGLPLCSVYDVRDELIYNADGTGKIIKRTGIYTISNGDQINVQENGGEYRRFQHPIKCTTGEALCTAYKYRTGFATAGETVNIDEYAGSFTIYNNSIRFVSNEATSDEFIANNLGVTVIYPLAESYEIELSADEMAALQSLQTFDGVTNIFNDEGAEIITKYWCDDSINALIDTKAPVNHTHTPSELGTDVIDNAWKLGNLIKNGCGEYLDNTNFEGATFTRDDGTCPEGCYGFFNGPGKTEHIPFDKMETYNIEYYCRKHDGAPENSSSYFSVIAYDIDGLEIKPGMSTDYVCSSHLFYLAEDLNAGDTVVHFTDLTNWNTEVTNAYQRSFLFYGYTDSTGYTYPDGTYSRFYYQSKYASNDSVDKTANTITLTTAWNGESFKAGTCVAHASSGGTYLYYGQSGVISNTNWQKHKTIIYMNGVATFNRLKYAKTISIYFNSGDNADYCGIQLTKRVIDTEHISNTSNPHNVTKEQLGLENVENKSSETIRDELTKENVTNALGYTPPEQDTNYTLDSFDITVTAEEINHNSGVTSNIQEQLDGKAASDHTHDEYISTAGATMEGELVAQANTNYTTAQVRNITMSTSEPTGGTNGQIHFQYS